ncbi:MAG: type I-E CRISPR-associated protein Cse2/CasB, partial [Desulfovibrionaceae bacterium]|nr:type I-E CRISPR-associated protein Cse2/CasB [Desulfovibrionaceae bacterium]
MNSDSFVSRVIELCGNPFVAAQLSSAAVPGCSASWGRLQSLGVNLDDPLQYAAHSLICASVAQSGMHRDGTAGLGKVLRAANVNVYRFRSLTTCRSAVEVCYALHSVFHGFDEKSRLSLSHARLLDELLAFDRNDMRVQTSWAVGYFGAAQAAREDMRAMAARDSLGRDQDFDGGPSP